LGKGRRLVMTSLLFKLITFPLGTLLAAWLFANVNFEHYYEPILIGLMAAVVGVLVEYVILRKGTLWLSTFSDVIINWVFLYVVANMFEGAYVTVWGALLTSLLIGVVDYFIISYFIKQDVVTKYG